MLKTVKTDLDVSDSKQDEVQEFENQDETDMNSE